MKIPVKKILKWGAASIVVLAVGLFVAVQVVLRDPEFGGDPPRERAELLQNSPHFRDGHFHNTLKERDNDLWVNLKEMLGDQERTPPAPFPLVKPEYGEEVAPGLRAVWFGHASVLVEIDGHRVFFDPMLSEHAFPVQAMAPERMNPPPLAMHELPSIDAVVVSHDHYDHLDMKSVQHLAKQGAQVFVGLGVGAHLEKWGIQTEAINELDWGDSVTLHGLTINCTEARHYSGRKSMSSNTLWTSWVVEGPEHTVFHSGDSGYSPHFKEIGEAFPDIDLSLIKVGDYGIDLGWQDIHMLPENSVKAHEDIGAKVMLPIHWGVFQLSFHPWDEPIERTIAAASESNVKLVTPKLGGTYQFGEPISNQFWWREL